MVDANAGAEHPPQLEDSVEHGRLLQDDVEAQNLLLAHVTQGLLIVQDGAIVVANARFAEMVDSTVAELQDAALEDALGALLPPTCRLVGQNPEEACTRGSAAVDAQGRCMCESTGPDGAQRWIEVLTTPVSYRGRSALHVSVTDVTELKQAEAEQRRLSDFLQALIATMPVGVAVVDADSVVSLANETASEILGGPMVGRSLVSQPPSAQPHTLLWPEGTPVAPHETPLGRAMTLGEVFRDEELIVRRADGSERVVLVSASPVPDSQGRIERGVVIFQDITQRREAERAVARYAADLEGRVAARTAELQAREAECRAIFTEAANGIALVGADGSILQANDAFHAMLGYEPESLEGLPFEVVVIPDASPDAGAALIDSLSGLSGPLHTEARLVRKDGEVRRANLDLSLVRTGGGEPAFAVAVAEDVTAQHDMQGTLMQAERYAAISRLAIALTHEINNPLQSVLGFLGLLREATAESAVVTAEVIKLLQMAHEDAQRVAMVVAGLRRLYSDTYTDTELPPNLAELVRGTRAYLEGSEVSDPEA